LINGITPISIASSGPPFLRTSTYSFSGSVSSVSCTLNNVVTGDELFAIVQASDTPQTSLTAIDSASDGFSYGQDWSYDIGMGGAYTQTGESGTITISLTVSNGLAALSLFCYDIGGAININTIFESNSSTSLLS
jgi:hypothetical protein